MYAALLQQALLTCFQGWVDILIGKLGWVLMRQVSGMVSQSDKSGTRPVGCGPASSSKGPSMKGMSSI